MSEMLNMIVGCLERNPVIMPAFQGRSLVKNYLIIESDDNGDRDAKIPIVAWDNEAEELMQYKENDKVYLLCEPTESMLQVGNSMIPVLGFKVLKVDHDRTILPQINKKMMEILNV